MLIIALKKCLSKNFLLKDLAAVSLPKLVLFLYFITFHQSCLRQNRRSKIIFFPNNKGLHMVCSLVNIKICLYFHNVNFWEKCLIYLLFKEWASVTFATSLLTVFNIWGWTSTCCEFFWNARVLSPLLVSGFLFGKSLSYTEVESDTL